MMRDHPVVGEDGDEDAELDVVLCWSEGITMGLMEAGAGGVVVDKEWEEVVVLGAEEELMLVVSIHSKRPVVMKIQVTGMHLSEGEAVVEAEEGVEAEEVEFELLNFVGEDGQANELGPPAVDKPRCNSMK